MGWGWMNEEEEEEDVERRGQVFVRDLVFTRGRLVQTMWCLVNVYTKVYYKLKSNLPPSRTNNLLLALHSYRTQNTPR